jgi:hypothetical protein
MQNSGNISPDGTVFAGVSPDTGRAMYTTPTDAHKNGLFGRGPLTFTFIQAQINSQATQYGHEDWRVPTERELHVIFLNQAAIGGFSEDLYWSSSSFVDEALIGRYQMVQDFKSGRHGIVSDTSQLHLRCVRG